MTTTHLTLDLSEDEETFILTAGLHHKHAISSIPGMRWKDGTTWVGPRTWAAACALAATFGTSLIPSERVKDYTKRTYDQYVSLAYRLAVSVDASEDPDVIALRDTGKFNLFDYQEAGVEFLSYNGRGGLFDPMGTGKTAQTASAMRIMQQRHGDVLPALIVCPNSVKSSWSDELALWWPDARPVDFGNNAKARREALALIKNDEADVLIANWEGLQANSRLEGYGSVKLSRASKQLGLLNEVDWHTVVADEAHRGKNPQAKQTRALWWLRRDAKYRFALTGTPMANNPGDLWAILHMIWPEEFPSRGKFIDRYCLVGFGAWGGTEVLGLNPANRQEFDSATRHLWRRTPKEIALPSLPPKVYVTHTVQMRPQQKRQYEEMLNNMIVEIEESDEVIVGVNALSRMTRMLQFASATAAVDANGDIVLKEPSCKLDALLEIMSDLEDDDQIVVFAQSRKLIELVANYFEVHNKKKANATKQIRYGMITGKQSVDERANNVRDFQDGKTRLILCTIAAGGVGITLTAASNVVFLQRSFSLVDSLQAEDRAHRIGSEIHDSIRIIDVVSENTLDSRVLDVATMKGDQLEDLLRDTDRLRALAHGEPPPCTIMTKHCECCGQAHPGAPDDTTGCCGTPLRDGPDDCNGDHNKFKRDHA